MTLSRWCCGGLSWVLLVLLTHTNIVWVNYKVLQLPVHFFYRFFLSNFFLQFQWFHSTNSSSLIQTLNLYLCLHPALPVTIFTSLFLPAPLCVLTPPSVKTDLLRASLHFSSSNTFFSPRPSLSPQTVAAFCFRTGKMKSRLNRLSGCFCWNLTLLYRYNWLKIKINSPKMKTFVCLWTELNQHWCLL